MADPRPPLRNEAVALAYTAGEAAPRVVAKGKGVVAREILERAREAGVFVHESPELVSLLMQVDLDARIPPQLYVAVAELLAWLYRLEQGADAGTAPVPARPARFPAPTPAQTYPSCSRVMILHRRRFKKIPRLAALLQETPARRRCRTQRTEPRRPPGRNAGAVQRKVNAASWTPRSSSERARARTDNRDALRDRP